MPWGSFPLIGIILGLAGGVLQYFLLIRVTAEAGGTKSAFKLVVLFVAKLALYALFIVPAFIISVPDGAVCGILTSFIVVSLSIYKSLRKGGRNK